MNKGLLTKILLRSIEYMVELPKTQEDRLILCGLRFCFDNAYHHMGNTKARCLSLGQNLFKLNIKTLHTDRDHHFLYLHVITHRPTGEHYFWSGSFVSLSENLEWALREILIRSVSASIGSVSIKDYLTPYTSVNNAPFFTFVRRPNYGLIELITEANKCLRDKAAELHALLNEQFLNSRIFNVEHFMHPSIYY